MSAWARKLLLLLILLLSISMLGAACGRSSRTVDVEIREGQLKIEPASVVLANYIKFRVTNVGTTRHSFLVVRTASAPGNLPVEHNHVRKCTRRGEVALIFYGDHGGWEMGCSPDGGLDPEDAAELDEEGPSGVTVAPGESKTFEQVGQHDSPFESGTRFVVYCDEAGHYEEGEYAGVVVK